MPKTFRNYIDGEWREPASGDYYENRNPADDRDLIGMFPLSDPDDVEAAVESAAAAAPTWRSTPTAERERLIMRFAEILDDSREEIGEAICREEGKTLKEATGEPNRAVEEVRYFMGEGRRLEGITMPSDREGVTSVAERVPLGVVAAITPWNFPFLTPLRKVIPALVTGNTTILKPASDTPHSGVLIAELMEKAGMPAGVFNLIVGKGGAIGDAISSDPRVRGISFTGSTAVGQRINRHASEHFGKVQLEMGGKNPAIVGDFGDLDYAAAEITSAAFAVSGQRCTSISRIIVLRDRAGELEAKIAERMASYVLGNGMDPKVTMGPVINRNAGEKIMGYIRGAEADGATITVGGEQLVGGEFDRGFYIEPTLITGVKPDMAAAREEIFGPVLVSIAVDSFEEAIAVANDTAYGLAASLFSDSLPQIHAFQQKVDTGMTHVNHGTKTDSCMPFGGSKNSGLGPFSKGKTNKDFFTNFKVNYTKFA